ncbi:MAG TPA: MFS transporter [Fimbriimonadaceae bacterium]|nr:MFS transporter [Fimbriimonadaceae bacterium]
MGEAVGKIGNYRWWIVAMLFFATTVNYVDRQVIGVLKPNISDALGWTKDNKEILYGYVTMAFQALYAAGYLLGGRLSDVIGLRKGYAWAVGLWSLMAFGTGFARSVLQLSIIRGGLGLAEGGNFPSAIKAVTEWFPAKERAVATGIFNAGSNFGPVLTPLIVPPLAVAYGWESAFFVTGAIGALWLIWWLLMYRPPEQEPRLGAAELEYIRGDPPDKPVHVPWGSLLGYRAVWAYIVGTAFSAPIWWFYLFWSPDFFFKRFGLDMTNIGPPLVAVYVLADVGSIGGGWLSSTLLKRGLSVTKARKTGLLVCALCVVPVFLAATVSNEWAAVGLIGLAAAAHQGWSANLYTWASDTMPRKCVSSVVGIGGMAGSLVSIFFSAYVAKSLQASHNYQAILMIPPCAYLIALGLMHLLVPKLEQVELREA